MEGRYSRQELFRGIGKNGQQRLLHSRVAIVGTGALGSASANFLARAGVGFLKLIDEDDVELCNIQRQILYDERDAKRSAKKVEAAYEKLKAVNSEIDIEIAAEHLSEKNYEKLLSDVDMVLDGSDNFAARFIINRACLEFNIPWIYGGAVEAEGITMNFIPGGACLGCLTGTENAEALSTSVCAEVGVLNTVPAIVAALQCTEAVKIMTGASCKRSSLLKFDIWNNLFKSIDIPKDKDCPICGKKNKIIAEKCIQI